MNITAESPSASTTAIQGGTAAMMIAYLNDALTIVVPYVFLAVALIIADLIFGIAASRKRGEEIRASRAARRTIDKSVSYLCWLIIAAFCTITFGVANLDKYILGIVLGIEAFSVFSNYLFVKGKKIVGLDKWLIKFIGQKTNSDTSDIHLENETKDRKKVAKK